MAPTRRPALLGVQLVTAAVLVTAAACVSSPPLPSATSSATRSPVAGGRYPLLIIRADDADSPRWFVTLPQDPSRRRPLAVPADALEVGAAGSDGTLTMTSAAQLLFVALRGDGLTVVGTLDLVRLGVAPGGPACIGPDRSVAIADSETLALTVVSPSGAVVAIDVPDALGECAWLDDGRLLVDREGDELVAADPGTGLSSPVDGGGGRHPSTAGGLLSLVDRSGGPRVVVRAGDLGGPGGVGLGSALFEIEAGPGALVSGAQFSPDGGWLAVEVTVDPESAAVRWLRLYRVAGGAAELATQVRLGAREQVILLPAP